MDKSFSKNVSLSEKAENYTNQIHTFLLINIFFGSVMLQHSLGVYAVDSKIIDSNFVLQLAYLASIAATFSFSFGACFCAFALINLGRINVEKKSHVIDHNIHFYQYSLPTRMIAFRLCCLGVFFSVSTMFGLFYEKAFFYGWFAILVFFIVGISFTVYYHFYYNQKQSILGQAQAKIIENIGEIRKVLTDKSCSLISQKYTIDQLTKNISQILQQLIQDTNAIYGKIAATSNFTNIGENYILGKSDPHIFLEQIQNFSGILDPNITNEEKDRAFSQFKKTVYQIMNSHLAKLK